MELLIQIDEWKGALYKAAGEQEDCLAYSKALLAAELRTQGEEAYSSVQGSLHTSAHAGVWPSGTSQLVVTAQPQCDPGPGHLL